MYSTHTIKLQQKKTTTDNKTNAGINYKVQ
jgi:hypothetical protein